MCVALFLVGGWGLARDIGLEDRLRAPRRARVTLEREAERAQLLALRAHLDPHFLFNTLNAIAEWCREDGEVAERAVLQLSAMLRTMLDGVRAPTWPLARGARARRRRCSRCTACATRAVRASSVTSPEPLPAVAVPPMVAAPARRERGQARPAAGHGGRRRLDVERTPDGQRGACRLDNPGPFAGRRAGGEGLRMVERRLALAYEGSGAAFTIAAAGRAPSPRWRSRWRLRARGAPA